MIDLHHTVVMTSSVVRYMARYLHSPLCSYEFRITWKRNESTNGYRDAFRIARPYTKTIEHNMSNDDVMISNDDVITIMI